MEAQYPKLHSLSTIAYIAPESHGVVLSLRELSGVQELCNDKIIKHIKAQYVVS